MVADWAPGFLLGNKMNHIGREKDLLSFLACIRSSIPGTHQLGKFVKIPNWMKLFPLAGENDVKCILVMKKQFILV